MREPMIKLWKIGYVNMNFYSLLQGIFVFITTKNQVTMSNGQLTLGNEKNLGTYLRHMI
jgi:hypothetical protein